MRERFQPLPKRFTALAGIMLVMALLIQAAPSAFAGPLLLNRFDKISNAQVSAVATHEIGFEYTDTTALGSVKLEFCQNDPIPDTACTVPAGFNASSAILSSQIGESGFTIHGSSNANTLILSRIPMAPALSNPSIYTFDNITNPSSVGTFYIRLTTYSANNAIGISIESGGIAISTSGGVSVAAEVPPFLRFCVGVTITGVDCTTSTGVFIDYGNLSTSTTAKASSEFVTATNAPSGYSVSVSGTTMTSGNDTIPALFNQSPSNPGTSQFGINLRQNTSPSIGADSFGAGSATASAAYNTPNQYRFRTGDTLASSTNADYDEKFIVSYITNISSSQTPGIYATTMTFLCLANF